METGIPTQGSTKHFPTLSHFISIVACTLEYSYYQLMVTFSPRLQNEFNMKPGQLGQSDSTVCFLSYNSRLILYWKQPHTDKHAESTGFYSFGVGKVSQRMTQILEDIKEET